MPQSTEPRSAARCSRQLLRLTSSAVLRLRLEEIKGCCCSIWHREELAVSVRMRRSHSPHFSIKGSLDMSTLPPDQRWNVPGRGSHSVTHPRCVNKLGEHISEAITNLPLISKHSNKQNCFCYDWTDSIALHSLTRAESLIRSPCWEISTKRPNADIPTHWNSACTNAAHRLHRDLVAHWACSSTLLANQADLQNLSNIVNLF